MKIVGVCACTAGLAHTFMAQKKLLSVGKERGHLVSIETQGSMGVENELSPEEIKNADFVILATDIKIGTERFKGKKVIKIPTNVAIKGTVKLYEKLEENIDK
ncbi:MAG: fructose PTS transporter subunit IIB [Candidatus Fusobacterium pullicola]|jgi:PTS system fructose-specific IIB component|uniref:Fructose PTS transporter subunit IIB n=1 Tax=Candidatus Fusobacterium pullicola TaxID=2838601 RepID=A0A9E2NZK1_9FUSO|nr:fructose PTS transporter subunit IIB [Candidatus Fusobacterium pullicola]